MPRAMKTKRTGSTARPMTIATVKPMATDMEAGNRERFKLYNSSRWRKARPQFLRESPLCRQCEQQGIIRAASVVDHVDGHAFRDWLQSFWDEARMQWLPCGEVRW